MTTSVETSTYDVEGRLLEVCSCNTLCPCWVGEDPDGGVCEGLLGWYVDRGTVQGVDVSDRCICLVGHIPGNILAGNWKAALLVDDRCTEEQKNALLGVWTGQLGGPIADLAGLVGEVVAVESVPITFEVEEGKGYIKVGDIAEARLAPFLGSTGTPTALVDSIFSTIPGSPAYVGKAEMYRLNGGRHGLADLSLQGHNAVQGSFRFSG